MNAAIKQPFPNCFRSQWFISYCTNILVLTFSYALIHSTSLYVFLSRVTCLVSGVHHFKVICLLLLCHVIWICSLLPGCCVPANDPDWLPSFIAEPMTESPIIHGPTDIGRNPRFYHHSWVGRCRSGAERFHSEKEIVINVAR